MRVDHACYLSRQVVVVSGEGFLPGSAVHVTLGGRRQPDFTADSTGAVRGNLRTPNVQRGRPRRRSVLLVLSDGTNSASAGVLVTRSGVDFAPSRGDPRRLRARFSLFGLGAAFAARGEGTRHRIYLHYLDPRGRRRRTFAVGYTGGPCGDLRTRRRRVLPFRPLYGLWRLVFDDRRAYRRSTQLKLEIGFRVRRARRR